MNVHILLLERLKRAASLVLLLCAVGLGQSLAQGYGPTRTDLNIEIGDGGEMTNQYLPSYSYFNYSLTQQVYTAAEIGTTGIINSIAFFNGGAEKTRTYDVYMVNTTKTAFEGNTDWITVSAADQVFSGSVTMVANAWTIFTLDTPFLYDGTSNLAVIVDDNTGSYTNSPHMACRVFETESSQAIRVYNDNTDYDPSNPTGYNGTLLNVKNQIVLGISTGVDFFSVLAVVVPDGAGTVSGTGWYEQGETCSLTATPNSDNYVFVSWTENGEVVSTSAQYSFTVTGNRELEANFMKKPIVEYYPDATDANSPYVRIDYHTDSWYQYHQNENPGVFTGMSGDFHWGIMLPAGTYDGSQLTTVSTYDYCQMTGTLTIYNDGTSAPTNPVGSMDITFDGVGQFVDFEFVEPVELNPDKNVWIIFHNQSGAQAPAALDRGTYEPNGNWRSSNGTDWNNNQTVLGDPCVFMIRAYIVSPRVNLFRTDCNSYSPTLLAELDGPYIDEEWLNLSEGFYKYGMEQILDDNNTIIIWSDCIEKHANIEVNIAAMPNIEGRGNINGTGYYMQGTTCTLTATANEGFEFRNWTEDGQEVSTDAEYSFTVTASRSLTAVFAPADAIVFACPNVEAICVNQWDTDGDGFLSYSEAAAVTSLNLAFRYNGNITSFNELQYFTGLTVINDEEFWDCYNLTSIAIPANVTDIGWGVFGYCNSLSTIKYYATNSYVAPWWWLDYYDTSVLTTLVIGDNVQTIPDNFLHDCTNLTSLVIPESVTSIGSSAFANCTGLTGTLVIPESVTSIGDRAFAGTNFSTVNFNATNCSYMGYYYDPVFADCNNLTTLNIGENVEVIPSYAFYGCGGMTGLINLPEALTSIGEGAFQNCTGFTGSLVIPDNVTVIGQYAFRECNGLDGTLTIGNSVTEIGHNAFYHCYGLSGELTIPDAVQTIGIGAFIDCAFTGTLTIGAGVTSINNAAFRRLNVDEVHWNAVNCTFAGDDYWGHIRRM